MNLKSYSLSSSFSITKLQNLIDFLYGLLLLLKDKSNNLYCLDHENTLLMKVLGLLRYHNVTITKENRVQIYRKEQ